MHLKINNLYAKILSKNLWIFLTLFIYSVILFHPSLQNKFYFWDDERFVFLNPAYLNAHSWVDFWNFKSIYFKSWPAGYSFFWFFDKILKIENLIYYKLINIIIHSINGLLVFTMLKKSKLPFAFLLSLIFIAHPLHVENVSWIFQLFTLSAFLFFILAFLFIKKYLDEKKSSYILLSFLFFMLSILSKSIAVLAPIFFLAYFLLKGSGLKKTMLLIPFFALAIFIGLINIKGTENLAKQKYSLASLFIGKLQHNDSPTEKNLSPEQIAAEDYFEFIYLRKKVLDKVIFKKSEIFSQGSLHYFSKIIFPIKQQFIYPTWEIPIAYSFLLWVLFIVFTTLVYKKGRDRRFIMAAVYIVIFLLPYLGVTYISFFYWSNVSDRYTYFLIPAFVVLIGLILKNKNTKIAGFVLSLYLIILTSLTINYGYKFNNPLFLYKEIIAYKKHPVIYSLLFEQYMSKADLINGEAILKEGREKFPDDELLKGDLMRLDGLKLIYKND